MHFTTLISAALAVTAASAQTQNLTSLLGSNSNLSTLAGILGQFPQFAAAVANRTNITLFAPSNAAFGALNSTGALASVSPTFIQDLLSYHVINGTILASAISSTPAFPHTNLLDPAYSNVTGGQVVDAKVVGNNVEIISGSGAVSTVTQANLNFTGGVVHVIDSVLTIPQNISTTAYNANLTSFLGALLATNLTDTVDTLHDVTIFAPSNSAFEAIGSATGGLNTTQLATILEYHVINGTVAYSSMLANETVPSLAGNLTVSILNGSVFVNQARVINADILVAGGVLHIIDSVLNPGNANATANATESGGVVGFSGASSGTVVPLTSGVPTASSVNSALATTISNVAAGYPSASAAAKSSGAAAGGASSASAAGAAAMAMPTGAIGAAALFGGAALIANM